MNSTDQIRPSDNRASQHSTEAKSSPVAPMFLILGAWVAGTLLFEISSFDTNADVGGSHWGAKTKLLADRPTVTSESSQLSVVKSAAKQLAETPAASVVTAGKLFKDGPATAAIELSSHQMEVRRDVQQRWLDLAPVNDAN